MNRMLRAAGALAAVLAASFAPAAYAAEGSIGLTAGSGTNAALTAPDGATFVSFIHGLCGGNSTTMGTACNAQVQVTASGLFANVNAWAGTTLGAPSNYGTSPGAVAVPGVNAFVTNTPAVTQSGAWNITNVSGTVSLPTGAATGVAQGSTTSGQSGTLAQGAVTTASPTYSTGQTSPLSLDTTGALRVNVTAGGGIGGTSSTFGAAFPGTGTASGFEYLSSPPTLSSGQMVAGQTDINGNLKVNIAAGGGGGTSSTVGSAYPSIATAVGLEYLSAAPTLSTGNMAAFQGDINGNLKVNIAAGSTTATVANYAPSAWATPLTVTPAGQSVPIPGSSPATLCVYNNGAVNANLALNTSSTVIATTSTDVVPPGGAFCFARGSNTYVTAITASGSTSLIVSSGSGYGQSLQGNGGGIVSQGGAGSAAGAWYDQLTFGGSVTSASNPTPVAAFDQQAVAPDSSFNTITAADSGTSTATGQNNQVFVTGTPTAGSYLRYTLPTFGAETMSITLAGTSMTPSVAFDISQDGSTWIQGKIVLMPTGAGNADTASACSAQCFGILSVGGMKQVRLRYTGTITTLPTVTVNYSDNPRTVHSGSAFNGTVGSSPPGNAAYVGMNVGGNLTGLAGTANGLKVDGSAVTQPVNVTPISGTGWTPVVKAALTNSAVSVKASAGSLGVTHCDNGNSATVYVEYFNTSSVTLGTTAPAWFVAIPAGGGGEGFTSGLNLGGSAIYVAVVTAYNGSTAPATTLNCSIGYI